MNGHPAIGIDLGTTFSAVAHLNPSGKAEIVPNSHGERVTASAVYFQSSGPVLVGAHAAAAAQGFPDRVVQWVKREMGDPAWAFRVDGSSYDAPTISAMILRKVKQDSEVVLGGYRHAVITVPAYFDEVRRKATMDAGKLAGIEVLAIINEPTAAALAYSASGQVRGRVLVYDFGGGTFDVSIVDIESEQSVKVVTSVGDHRLGGHDLDEALASHLDELFQREHGTPLIEDPASRAQALAKAETAKRTLSAMPVASPIELLRGTHAMSASLDRKTFEELTREYLVRTELLVEEALDEASSRPADIDAVLLVGGSTRVPAVRQLLERMFGKAPLRGINPDEAVALGAAIHAGKLLTERGLSDLPKDSREALKRMRLQDVTSHPYGTLSIDSAFGVETLRNTVMIPKNSPIPASQRKSFYTIHDNQAELRCTITQGEDPDPDFVNLIAEQVMNLPPNRPAGREVAVTFSYDANQRMSCDFLDVESGRSEHFDLDMARFEKDKLGANSLETSFDDIDFDDLNIE